ncbi:MAG: hypothetical protein ABIC57_04255 [bacterium]
MIDKELEQVEEIVRRRFPHGHPGFITLTLEELDLHSRKNSDYAKGGDPLGNFKRVASILRNYPNLDVGNPIVIAIVYALKQLDAALWMLSQGYEGQVENVNMRLQDVHVYVKIARLLRGEEDGEDTIR